MKKLTIALFAAAGMTGLAAMPAQAQEVRVPIAYADLDTGSEAGAATLASRIESRVNVVCARSVESRDLKAVPQCRAELLSNAVAQLNERGEDLVAGKLALKA